MKFSTTSILIAALSLAPAAQACDIYNDCKCHDSRTKLQNDEATKHACSIYVDDGGGKPDYNDEPHHQCHQDYWWDFVVKTSIRYGGIDNCAWDDACKKYDPNMYQYCWNKLE